MHLIVLTPSAQGRRTSEPQQDLQALIARWNPLMPRLQPLWTLNERDDALNTLAERACAQVVLGRALQDSDDGRLPLLAWQRASAQDASSHTQALARLTPYHGLVGSDRITMVPPEELALQEPESKALFDAVEPLFSSEGVRLEWLDPLQWQVQHESLAGLPCASLDRVVSDSVQRWQVRTPLASARLIRRLQNEAQMVLHEHPVNQARAQQGALPVNSLWLDHAGTAIPLKDSAGDASNGGRLQIERWHGLKLHRLPQADVDAAIQAWFDRALRHEGADPPLWILCGRHQAQAWGLRRAPQGWRGVIERTLKRPPPSPSLSEWIQRLDTEPDGTAP